MAPQLMKSVSLQNQHYMNPAKTYPLCPLELQHKLHLVLLKPQLAWLRGAVLECEKQSPRATPGSEYRGPLEASLETLPLRSSGSILGGAFSEISEMPLRSFSHCPDE